MSCEATQEELTELLVTQRASTPEGWDPVLRGHVRECAACAGHLRLLRALTASLAGESATAPSPAAVFHTRMRAMRALRAHRPSSGFARELIATVTVLVLALPIAVAQVWLVATGAEALLEPLVPHLVLVGLGAAYFGTFLLMVGTLYAVVPLWVATVRRARLEVS